MGVTIIDILGDDATVESSTEPCEVCGRETGGCCTLPEKKPLERRTRLQIINIKGEIVDV